MSDEPYVDPIRRFDISPLRRAIARVEKSLSYTKSPMAQNDPDVFYEFRQSSIQAFEYTYELSVKTLDRFIRIILPTVVDVRPTFNELIRAGISESLLSGTLRTWSEFREKRNISSHVDDEDKAQLAFASIAAFTEEAKYLADAIDAKISRAL